MRAEHGVEHGLFKNPEDAVGATNRQLRRAEVLLSLLSESTQTSEEQRTCLRDAVICAMADSLTAWRAELSAQQLGQSEVTTGELRELDNLAQQRGSYVNAILSARAQLLMPVKTRVRQHIVLRDGDEETRLQQWLEQIEAMMYRLRSGLDEQ